MSVAAILFSAVPSEAEDAIHDSRFDGVDDAALAWVRRVGWVLLLDCRVAAAPAAGPEAAQGATFEPAVRLGANELKEGVVHERHRAERQPRSGAVRRHAGRHVDYPRRSFAPARAGDTTRSPETLRDPTAIGNDRDLGHHDIGDCGHDSLNFLGPIAPAIGERQP